MNVLFKNCIFFFDFKFRFDYFRLCVKNWEELFWRQWFYFFYYYFRFGDWLWVELFSSDGLKKSCFYDSFLADLILIQCFLDYFRILGRFWEEMLLIQCFKNYFHFHDMFWENHIIGWLKSLSFNPGQKNKTVLRSSDEKSSLLQTGRISDRRATQFEPCVKSHCLHSYKNGGGLQCKTVPKAQPQS